MFRHQNNFLTIVLSIQTYPGSQTFPWFQADRFRIYQEL